ncbi:MAG: ecdysteroid 22-kinase family protein [Myxococcales bacterium]|nr:ecdysteroid 22-kinase family protein [Myxococcales bacterium]
MTAALRGAGLLPRGEVTQVSLASPEEEGNAGSALRAQLCYSGDAPAGAPATLIVKLPPDAPGRRAAMLATGFVRAEAGFYRDLQPRVPIRTPRCYLAQDDDEGNAVLLLEDLGDVPGSWPARRLDAAHARSMFARLAELHAHFWNDEQLVSHRWLQPPTARVDFWRSALSEIVELLHDVVDGTVPPQITALREIIVPRLTAIAAHLDGPPFTLVHGDFTFRNAALLDGEPVAFDWQLCQRMRGARDVAYLMPFLDLTDDPGVRPDELVNGYHDALVARGVHDYTRAELAYDQTLAAIEVMQVGLATLWPSLRSLRAEGRRIPLAKLGLVQTVAVGIERLGLIELVRSDFSA